MRHGKWTVVSLVVLLLLASSVWAETLDFEDLWPGFETGGVLFGPYDSGGFVFTSQTGWITKNLVAPSGYQNTINGHVGVYTYYEQKVSLWRAQPFNVASIKVGAAWNDGQYARIQGWLGRTLVGEVNRVVSYYGETVTLNFANIDTLVVITNTNTGTDHSPNDAGWGHHVVIDDINLGGETPAEPPEANAGDDQTVEQASAAGTQATLDGSGSTGEAPLTYAWYEGLALLGTSSVIKPTLQLGTHTIRLEVTDANGQSGSDEVVVTVQDTTAPGLIVPDDVTAEQTSRNGTPVDIGEASANDICDADVDVTNDAPAVFPLGQTVVTWTATDDSGNSATATQTVTVVDTTTPGVTLTILQSTLWPVNHKLVRAATVQVSDICDVAPRVSIDVTSNEPINGLGDGNTDPDWVVVKRGNAWDIWLRAERAGNLTGRVYTVTAYAMDASGNVSASATDTVTVPHDKRK